MNSTLKETYTGIQNLYENAVNILTALNQSLSSNSSEVNVTITTKDNISETIRIPSFLYLENKLEQLSVNFETLFNIPENGEAWLTGDSNLYLLELIKSHVAPAKPLFTTQTIYSSYTDNNFLKDLVFPKMYLRVQLQDLPANIEELFMRKIVIYNESLFNALNNLGLTSYTEYAAMLDNYSIGSDYDMYDSTVDLPLQRNRYAGSFEITEIIDNKTIIEDENSTCEYTVLLNGITYYDADDHSIEYTLRKGDVLTVASTNTKYQINSINISSNTIVISELQGHLNLTTTEDNGSMVLYVEDEDKSDYQSVQIPLEENRYICVFLGTIYNNVRSDLSKGILLDLAQIKMRNPNNGELILDESGSTMSYMDYYEKYCTNIGDIVLGICKTAYPLTTNFTSNELLRATTADSIQQAVSGSFDENILQVVPINKHLTDDVTNQNIVDLSNLKNDINSQLLTVQENIDSTYNTLVSTDFSQDLTVTQLDLQSKLTSYYTERVSLQRQLIALVDNIDLLSGSTDVSVDTKYRVRGIADTSTLETLIHETISSKIDIIGCDIEYKYKSVTKDTTTATIINANVFTDWNKQYNIDRQRELVIGSTNVGIKFTDYNTNDNIIKWNQFDIPIQQGEDVVIRVRYKYNIGQPFINLYTPWSDEITMVFPEEYKNNTEIINILEQNQSDAVSAKFNKTLINEGYSEHNNDKLISGDQTFYHNPEHIFSGFTTTENNLISLKEKLYSMNNALTSLELDVNNIVNSAYEVYLTYDNVTTELLPNTFKNIDFNNDNSLGSRFTKIYMNIVIKNTGDVPIRFYSLFPGDVSTPLILTDNEYFNNYIGQYENVPIFVNGYGNLQTMNQWIYFRNSNPFTKEHIYTINKSTNWSIMPSQYMKSDFSQPSYVYRNRTAADYGELTRQHWNIIYNMRRADDDEGIMKVKKYDGNNTEFINWSQDITDETRMTAQKVIYNLPTSGADTSDNVSSYSKFINRYEDIFYTNQQGTHIYLDEKTYLADFINNFVYDYEKSSWKGFNKITNYTGAFLYPNINSYSLSISNTGTNVLGKDSYKILEVGSSVSIPVELEYFIDSSQSDITIKKGLYFDLRTSLFRDPQHYLLNVVIKNKMSQNTNDGLINIADTLIDEATTSI